MVNTGRPSRGCAICRRRKIKCDLVHPACTQCQKAGWGCPGFPEPVDLAFRHQTSLVLKKVQETQPAQRCGETSVRQRGGAGVARMPMPSLERRGMAFFMRCYVSDQSFTRGNHEYLPALLENTAEDSALEIITAAAGLAALANVGASPDWKSRAYSMYGTAIRRLRASLQAPDQVASDQTLAAVMMMGVFEVIASGNLDSMKSFAMHTIAAARCIEMRGPDQFRKGSGAPSALFLQLRRIIVMTSHQLQEPVPFILKRWSSWAESAESGVEAASNRFSELNEKLAAARAEIKHRRISSPEVVSAMLLPIDAMFEDWRKSLPASWAYKSYRHLTSTGHQEREYTSQYDVYPDLYIASTWNSYRSVRILIHEAIIAAIMKRGAHAPDTDTLNRSLQVLRAMADGVCHSVPYHLYNYRTCPRGRDFGLGQDERSGELALSGAYVLFWPLFLSGMLRVTPKDQRLWIASTLRRIGLQMGLRLAMSMATALETVMSSFSAEEAWFIGEFYPC